MLPPAFHFPPSWRGKLLSGGQWEGGGEHSAAPLPSGAGACHKEKRTLLLLGGVPFRARSPCAHTAAFVILMCL